MSEDNFWSPETGGPHQQGVRRKTGRTGSPAIQEKDRPWFGWETSYIKYS